MRMTSAQRLFPPDGDDCRTIHGQGRNRRAARRCQTDDSFALPMEMLAPILRSWTKQRRFLAGLRIDGRLPREFAKRARDTGQCEILEDCWAIRDSRYDMVDMERGFLADLR